MEADPKQIDMRRDTSMEAHRIMISTGTFRIVILCEHGIAADPLTTNLRSLLHSVASRRASPFSGSNLYRGVILSCSQPLLILQTIRTTLFSLPER